MYKWMNGGMKVPVYCWAEGLEEGAMEQVENLSKLPFAFHHVALMPDCLTEDTEVLTSKGFKLIKDLHKGDLVANVNPEADISECNVFFAPPKDIIVREMKNGEKILSFYSSHFDKEIRVTNKHRMPLSTSLGIEAEKIPSITSLKDYEWGGHGLITEELNISDEFLCLVAWTVGDGSIKYSNKKKDGSYSSRVIRFGIKKERKINRIVNLLDCLQYKYSINYTEKQTTIAISVADSAKVIEVVGDNKEYPLNWISKLSKRQAVLFLDEAIKVDGDYVNFIKNNSIRYNSKRESDMNFISALIAVNIGVSNTNYRVSNGFKDIEMGYTNVILNYNLYEANNGMHDSKIIKREFNDYSGKVVCITCDSGFFIARQDGLTFVTGNCHQGYGMPIGGVLATKGIIIPNAVGSDIGCGMVALETDLHHSLLTEDILKKIVGKVRENIPVGFNKRKDPIDWKNSEVISYILHSDLLSAEYKNSTYQIGTLGGGNHFIELQVADDTGHVWLMIHSGSRNLGNKVCNHYNNIAKLFNAEWYSNVLPDLAFLPLTSQEGKDYWNAMEVCLNFAHINRDAMMTALFEIVRSCVSADVDGIRTINAHHNYATMENHFGENVIIHRKGAIRAREGDLGIIPGSMGTPSYIVEGLGNPASFMSASHGAGRVMSRKKANEMITEEMANKAIEGVVFGKWNGKYDEAPQAYKNIEEVMENQKDLVKPIVKLRPIAVVKG